MSIISLEQQEQIGRLLKRTRRNNQDEPDSADPTENTGETGGMSAVGTASFIMLGGFALLKDIFDFVFVGMMSFKSWWTTAGQVVDYASWATGKWIKLWVQAIIEAGIQTMYALGSASEAKAQAEGLIMPFIFTTMFMIVVVATLLLSGMGLKSYKIFLSTRFIFGSLVATIAEIVPVLNIFPWTTIFVIFLFFHVKRELKKQQEETQTA